MPPFAEDSADHLITKALTCDPITIKANLYFVVPNFIQHSSIEDGKNLSDFFFLTVQRSFIFLHLSCHEFIGNGF